MYAAEPNIYYIYARATINTFAIEIDYLAYMNAYDGRAVQTIDVL